MIPRCLLPSNMMRTSSPVLCTGKTIIPDARMQAAAGPWSKTLSWWTWGGLKNSQDTVFNKRWKKNSLDSARPFRNSMDAPVAMSLKVWSHCCGMEMLFTSLLKPARLPQLLFIKGDFVRHRFGRMDTSFMVPLPKYKGADGFTIPVLKPWPDRSIFLCFLWIQLFLIKTMNWGTG